MLRDLLEQLSLGFQALGLFFEPQQKWMHVNLDDGIVLQEEDSSLSFLQTKQRCTWNARSSSVFLMNSIWKLMLSVTVE